MPCLVKESCEITSGIVPGASCCLGSQHRYQSHWHCQTCAYGAACLLTLPCSTATRGCSLAGSLFSETQALPKTLPITAVAEHKCACVQCWAIHAAPCSSANTGVLSCIVELTSVQLSNALVALGAAHQAVQPAHKFARCVYSTTCACAHSTMCMSKTANTHPCTQARAHARKMHTSRFATANLRTGTGTGTGTSTGRPK